MTLNNFIRETPKQVLSCAKFLRTAFLEDLRWLLLLFYIPLKMSKIIWFSAVFRWYRKQAVNLNGLSSKAFV